MTLATCRLRRWVVTISIERKWADLWIGAYWRTRGSMGYEIDPAFPVTRTKRGTPFQRTNFDLWVCVVPCLPLHVAASRPWGTN